MTCDHHRAVQRGGNYSLHGLARSLNASASPRLVAALQAARRSRGLPEIPGARGNPAVPHRISATPMQPLQPARGPRTARQRAARLAGLQAAAAVAAGRLRMNARR